MMRTALPLAASALALTVPMAARTEPAPAPTVDPAAQSQGATIQRIGGLNRPMGAVYDAGSDRFLVANAADGGLSAKGRGYISTIAPDGRIVSLKWAKPLNAPKGMRIAAERLYVADLDGIAVIDLGSGHVIRRIAVAGAHNLVDLTLAADGTIFAVDNGKSYAEGALYRIDPDGAVELVARGSRFLHPLSIELVGGDLFIGPEIGGSLLRFSLSGQVLDVLPMPMERLQGTVVRPGDGVGGLFRIDARTIIASNRESGTLAVLDLSRPAPDPAVQVERLAEQLGASFVKALEERRKRGEAQFYTRGINKIATGSTVEPVDPGVFAVRGLVSPGKFAFDPKRRRFLIPEIGSNSVTIATLAGPLLPIARSDPGLY